MKKLLLLLAGFAAGAAAASAAPRVITIGLVAKSQGNPVFQAARVGAQDAAKDLSAKLGLDIRIDWRTPNEEDAQKQAEAIEQLVLAGAEGLAVSCSDANKLTDAINRAVDNGVPVATFDSDAPASKRFVTYGVDDIECGRQTMAELAKVMGGKGVVAILAGNQNAPNLQRRVQGAKEEAKKYPGITIRDTYYHKETPQDAAAKVEQVMQANPDITGVISGNDTMALGAQAALLAAGRGDVVVVGFDGSDEATAAVRWAFDFAGDGATITIGFVGVTSTAGAPAPPGLLLEDEAEAAPAS